MGPSRMRGNAMKYASRPIPRNELSDKRWRHPDVGEALPKNT